MKLMAIRDLPTADRPPLKALPSAPPAPTERAGLLRAEHRMVRAHLHRYFAWVDAGRAGVEPPPLRSGVGRSSWSGATRVATSAAVSKEPPRAADPSEDTDLWLTRLDGLMTRLTPLERQLCRWKVAGPDDPDRPTIPEIAERLGLTPRVTVEVWRGLALRIASEIWPGASGGFARFGRGEP
jgi:hypothetical protein